MLQKEFFQVQPFNPNPYWDPVIVNLAGAQKFEEDTVFVPGRYKIEIAQGSSIPSDGISNTPFVEHIEIISKPYMEHIETISEPFIVRAYCGGNATSSGVGTNPYSGPFKVNGKTSLTHQPGIDVNHIFGAGGGNGYRNDSPIDKHILGGGNCLGNGTGDSVFDVFYGGAGSCLHLLPVGGVFGTDYLRAYHICGAGNGSAYGGAAGAVVTYAVEGYWATRGGNSPYGNGGPGSTTGNYPAASGSGIGSARYVLVDGHYGRYNAGAYFNGTIWIDEPGINTRNDSSYIRITYLGPINE